MGIQDNSFSMVSKSCQDQNLSTVKSHQSLTVFYKLNKQKKQTLSFDRFSKTRSDMYDGSSSQNRVTTY